MSEALSRSARRVQGALVAAGCDASVVELPASTRTAEEAAAAIGCLVEEIAKSVVFRRGDSGRAVLVVLRGVDRVDTAALARQIGTPVKRADAEFVRQATGFAIGGVPPLGHESPLEIVADEGLLQYEFVWAAAGTPNSVFRIEPRRLLAAAGASLVSVVEGRSSSPPNRA